MWLRYVLCGYSPEARNSFVEAAGMDPRRTAIGNVRLPPTTGKNRTALIG
jgi:hypothetical protein